MLEVKCPEHLEKVRAFAASIGKAYQLQSRLDFLADYGNAGLEKDDPRRRENKCVLSWDFAPHSFGFTMYRADPDEADGFRYWFIGGLVYQGPDSPANGGAPSYTVSLAEGVGWFVHT